MNAMSDKNSVAIDLAAVRDEIAAAHERTAQWERSLDLPPTAVAHWTKLVELAGPNLQKALRAGIVYIEIREKAASPNGYGKPRFMIKGDPGSDPEKGQ
jgi:hypothetical protein